MTPKEREYNGLIQQAAGAIAVAVHGEMVIGIMSRGPDQRPPRVTVHEKYALAHQMLSTCRGLYNQGEVVAPESQYRWLMAMRELCEAGLRRLALDDVTGRVTTLSPCDSLDEFLSLFGEVSIRDEVLHGKQVAPENLLHEEVHEKIRGVLRDKPDCLGMVCFENLDLSSSGIGDRSALVFGKGCFYETLDEIKDGHLGETPSTFKYPVRYWVKPPTVAAVASENSGSPPA